MSDAVAEIADLRALLAARDAELVTARAELTGARLLIAQYQAQLAKLRRMQFGRSSETLDAEIQQLEFLLEDLEEGEAARAAPESVCRNADRSGTPASAAPSFARPLCHARQSCMQPVDRCPACGGLHFAAFGEDVTEILEKVPARLRVIRHKRPKLSCRACATILQAPAPDLPVAKGRPGPGLLANVVVSKYLDGLPLYRQSAILAREGIAIERATLADWVGHAAWWLKPLAECIAAHVLAAPVIHTDDTPSCGAGAGSRPYPDGTAVDLPAGRAAMVRLAPTGGPLPLQPGPQGRATARTPGRGFHGMIQADAYSGYEALTRGAQDRRASSTRRVGLTPGASSSTCTRRRSRPLRPKPCGASASFT